MINKIKQQEQIWNKRKPPNDSVVSDETLNKMKRGGAHTKLTTKKAKKKEKENKKEESIPIVYFMGVS